MKTSQSSAMQPMSNVTFKNEHIGKCSKERILLYTATCKMIKY